MRAEQSELTTPRIISRNCACLSPWVTLETVSVAHSEVPEHIEVFHAFRQNDYVHVLTMTRQGTFIVVRQYRPVYRALDAGISGRSSRPWRAT